MKQAFNFCFCCNSDTVDRSDQRGKPTPRMDGQQKMKKWEKNHQFLYLKNENPLFIIQEQSQEATSKEVSNEAHQSLSNPTERQYEIQKQIPNFIQQAQQARLEFNSKQTNLIKNPTNTRISGIQYETQKQHFSNKEDADIQEETKKAQSKQNQDSQRSENFSVPEEISIDYDESTLQKIQQLMNETQTTQSSLAEQVLYQQQMEIQQQKLIKEQQNKEKLQLQKYLAQNQKQASLRGKNDKAAKLKEQKKIFNKNIPY